MPKINKHKLFILMPLLITLFHSGLYGQGMPDSVRAIKKSNQLLLDSINSKKQTISQLQKEKKNIEKELDNYIKKNKKKIDSVKGFSSELSSLKTDIIKIRRKIKLDSIKKEKVQIYIEVKSKLDSLKNEKEKFHTTVLDLDNSLKSDSIKLDSLLKIQYAIKDKKIFLENPSDEMRIAHKRIDDYLRFDLYNKFRNEQLINSISPQNKYYSILNEYCEVASEAYVIMASIINFGNDSFALKIYDSGYKPKVLKWKISYPWIFEQFAKKEAEMIKEVYNSTNPFQKLSCTPQQK